MQRLVALLPLLALVGCSSDLPFGPVTGKVTINGKPVTAGRVLFVGKQSGSASAELNAEGVYSIPDAPSGDVAVAVCTKDRAKILLPGGKVGKDGGSASFTPNQKPNPAYVATPAKYEDPTTSGLTTAIPKGGRQPFVFDITLVGN